MGDSNAPVARLALLGCGLMGGSLALALRAARAGSPPLSICGYSRSRGSAERAQALGIIDEVSDSAAQAVQGADLVVLAVPVTATGATLAAMVEALEPGALVMDVGSTKRDVAAAARQSLGAKVGQFVPAHPIAGKEQGGIDQAEAMLYRDRACILTPLPENTETDLRRAQQIWEVVGCRVSRLSPEAHDQTFAAVSHLPHLLAFAFVDAIAAQPQAARHLALAGPGFRDFSRIACSSSAIWRDIFSANRDEVLDQLQRFESSLADFRRALQEGDEAALTALSARLDAASAVRSAWRLNGLPAPGDRCA